MTVPIFPLVLLQLCAVPVGVIAGLAISIALMQRPVPKRHGVVWWLGATCAAILVSTAAWAPGLGNTGWFIELPRIALVGEPLAGFLMVGLVIWRAPHANRGALVIAATLALLIPVAFAGLRAAAALPWDPCFEYAETALGNVSSPSWEVGLFALLVPTVLGAAAMLAILALRDLRRSPSMAALAWVVLALSALWMDGLLWQAGLAESEPGWYPRVVSALGGTVHGKPQYLGAP